MNLHERITAELDRRETIVREAAQANPGAAALDWSAEKVDDRHRDELGILRKVWAIVPAKVQGIVLAWLPAEILPRVATHIALHDPADAQHRYTAARRTLQRHAPCTAGCRLHTFRMACHKCDLPPYEPGRGPLGCDWQLFIAESLGINPDTPTPQDGES